jgi:hypothetical protein
MLGSTSSSARATSTAWFYLDSSAPSSSASLLDIISAPHGPELAVARRRVHRGVIPLPRQLLLHLLPRQLLQYFSRRRHDLHRRGRAADPSIRAPHAQLHELGQAAELPSSCRLAEALHEDVDTAVAVVQEATSSKVDNVELHICKTI